MDRLNDRKKAVNIIETAFNILYLLLVSICAIVLCLRMGKILASISVFVLAVGDSFHLIPRIFAMWSYKKDYFVAIGVGKLITSIGMTLFYLGLFFIAKITFAFGQIPIIVAVAVLLVIVRIGLCLLATNNWKEKDNNYKLGIYRNIPFFMLGVLTAVMYFVGQSMLNKTISILGVLILISFAFYLPVVLFVRKYPKLGMLMLPKSVVYVIIAVVLIIN